MSKATSTRITSNIIFVFLCILFILLPFSATLNTFLRYKLDLGVFSFWKEALIAMIGGIVLFKRQAWKEILSTYRLGLIVSILFLLGVVYHLLLGGKFGFGELVAFRLDMMPIIAVIVGVMAGKIMLNNQTNRLVEVLIYSTFVSMVFGLVIHLIWGGEAWTWFGYRFDWSTFYSGEALAFCQRIENSEVCRFQGFLSGPNQMGAFLMFVMGLIMWKKPKGSIVMAITCMVGILLTFSRSAYLATAVLIGGYLLLEQRNWLKHNWKIILSGGLLAGSLMMFAFWEEILTVIKRPESNSEHARLWMEGVSYWFEAFWFGNGVGSIGPASRYTEYIELIPESWFLQVAGQYGFFGLSLFLVWYGNLIKTLKDMNKTMMLCWIGMIIPLSLLHVFESSALVIGMGIITGIILVNQSDLE